MTTHPDIKISSLPEATVLSNNDIFLVIRNPNTYPTSNIVTVNTIIQTVNASITHSTPKANTTSLGVIKVGSGLSIANDGTLSSNSAKNIQHITMVANTPFVPNMSVDVYYITSDGTGVNNSITIPAWNYVSNTHLNGYADPVNAGHTTLFVYEHQANNEYIEITTQDESPFYDLSQGAGYYPSSKIQRVELYSVGSGFKVVNNYDEWGCYSGETDGDYNLIPQGGQTVQFGTYDSDHPDDGDGISVALVAGDQNKDNTNGGTINITAGSGYANVNSHGGSIDIQAGASGNSIAGTVYINAGATYSGTPGEVIINGGLGVGPNGGNVSILGGNSVNSNGGSVILRPGSGDNLPGNIILETLPTNDPGITNALWNSDNTVVLSGYAGSAGGKRVASLTTNSASSIEVGMNYDVYNITSDGSGQPQVIVIPTYSSSGNTYNAGDKTIFIMQNKVNANDEVQIQFADTNISLTTLSGFFPFSNINQISFTQNGQGIVLVNGFNEWLYSPELADSINSSTQPDIYMIPQMSPPGVLSYMPSNVIDANGNALSAAATWVISAGQDNSTNSASSNTGGGEIYIIGGYAYGYGAGGSINLEAGQSDQNNGGSVYLNAGNGPNAVGGEIQLAAGAGSSGGGGITLSSGVSADYHGGGITLNSGNGGRGGGDINIIVGNRTSSDTLQLDVGQINVFAGPNSNGIGGHINIFAGNTTGDYAAGTLTLSGGQSTAVGGDVIIQGGPGVSGGSNGHVYINNLPTVDPNQTNALWNNNNNLVLSGYADGVYSAPFNSPDSTVIDTGNTPYPGVRFRFVAGVVQVAGPDSSTLSVFGWTGSLTYANGVITGFGGSGQSPAQNAYLSLNPSNPFVSAGDTVVINITDYQYGYMYRVTAMGSPTNSNHGTMSVEKLL